MRKFWAIVILIPLMASCDAISSLIHDDQVVAKVGSSKLYKSELNKLIPDLISAEDSAKLATRYINSWALDRLYTEVAQQQLSKSELDVNKELEAYRLSLIKYRYEQRYINDRLDTLVTDKQLEEYYESHKEDFRLSVPILKVRFVDVMKDSPSKDAILKMIASDDDEVLQSADTLARSSALRYFDKSDTWMDARDLSKVFGVDYIQMLSAMKDNMIIIEPENRGDILAAFVCQFQKSGIAPIDYCSPLIRDIIISNRKHQLIEVLEQDLLSNALVNNNFEIIQ